MGIIDSTLLVPNDSGAYLQEPSGEADETPGKSAPPEGMMVGWTKDK